MGVDAGARAARTDPRPADCSAVIQRMWDKGRDRLNAVRGELGLAPVRHFMDQAHRPPGGRW